MMQRPQPRDHFREPQRPTPFHERLAAVSTLNQWYSWNGYAAAGALSDAEQEYFAIRNAATVFDVTPMVKYRIAGADAEAFLDRVTLRDVAKLGCGRVHYTAWCDDAGKVLDDGTLFRLGPTDFLLCCQEHHLSWLQDSAFGYRVTVAEVTEEVAALSLQGPTAATVLRNAAFPGVDALKPFQIMEVELDAVGAVTVSRTGFTGDLGYELFVEPGAALALWDRLFEAGALHGIRPIGYAALDLARLEAGFIVANSDFITAEKAVRVDRRRSPFEIGLEWMVDFAQPRHFNGRRALLSEKERGTSRHTLVALDLEGNVPAEHALIYHRGKKEVGHITKAAWSPTAKRNIALASLERPYGDTIKEDLWVEIYALRELLYQKSMVRARICERPFFNPSRRRATPPAAF